MKNIEFKIESNIPIVAKMKGSLISQTLRSMKPGQSFQFEKPLFNNISATAYRLKGQGKLNYTIRSIGNNKYRIWIIEKEL